MRDKFLKYLFIGIGAGLWSILYLWAGSFGEHAQATMLIFSIWGAASNCGKCQKDNMKEAS